MKREEFFIKDDGIQIHCKLDIPDHVTKCPLVLIFHGLTGHMEEVHIAGVAQQVNNIGYASLRAEMYGHGQTTGKFEDHTLLKWISNGLKVIDYARNLDFVTDLYITGHSQGGLLTIILAGMKPDLFKAVMPLSPALVITDGAHKGNLLGMEFDPDHIPETIGMGPFVLKGNYIAAAQLLHPEECMHRYHGPVLIIQGDEDMAVPAQYSIDAAREYDNCTLKIIRGSDHGYTGHLEEVYADIIEFLRTVA